MSCAVCVMDIVFASSDQLLLFISTQPFLMRNWSASRNEHACDNSFLYVHVLLMHPVGKTADALVVKTA